MIIDNDSLKMICSADSAQMVRHTAKLERQPVAYNSDTDLRLLETK